MSELIYGFHPVLNALRNNRVIKLIVAKDSKLNPDLEPFTKQMVVDYWDKAAFRQHFPQQAHQRIATVCKPLKLYDENLLKQPLKQGLYLLLDSITDPHNFGACIRNAVAYDCDGIIFTKRNAAPLSAACCKAAAGMIEWIKLIRVANAARAIEHLKQKGYWVIATDSSASDTIMSCNCVPPLVVIMGGEGKGIHRLLLDKSDYFCRIAATKSDFSFNVSTATAYAWIRFAVSSKACNTKAFLSDSINDT